MRIQLLIVLILAGSVTAIAQSTLMPSAGRRDAQPPASVPGIHVNGATRQSKNPYERLFVVPKDHRIGLGPTQLGPEEPKRKTVCGLTVWNLEPDFDRRILLKPRDSRVEYAIRKLEPTVCAE